MKTGRHYLAGLSRDSLDAAIWPVGLCPDHIIEKDLFNDTVPRLRIAIIANPLYERSNIRIEDIDIEGNSCVERRPLPAGPETELGLPVETGLSNRRAISRAVRWIRCMRIVDCTSGMTIIPEMGGRIHPRRAPNAAQDPRKRSRITKDIHSRKAHYVKKTLVEALQEAVMETAPIFLTDLGGVRRFNCEDIHFKAGFTLYLQGDYGQAAVLLTYIFIAAGRIF